MSDFHVDVRFPSKIFSKAPFIYIGPDFKPLSLGVLSDFLTHELKEYQRLYPITVSESIGKNKFKDLLFSFLFIYVNNSNEKVVNLSHPVKVNKSDEDKALNFLILEAEKIARFYENKIIEMEIHSWTDSEILFPSSLSLLHFMKNSSSLIEMRNSYLEKKGFSDETEISSYGARAHKISTLTGDEKKKKDPFKIRKPSPKEYMDVKKTLKFKHKSFELSEEDEIFKPTNIPFFENTDYILSKTVGWLSKKEKTEGMLRWVPNLFEPCIEKNSPYPLLFLDSLEKYNYKGAKIFDWGFNEDIDILNELILTAIIKMKEKGIENIQFSNVEENQKQVKVMLDMLGFEKNHKSILFRKRVKE